MKKAKMDLLVPQVHLVMIIMVAAVVIVFAPKGSAQPLPKPGCKDKCGNINITYPFGIGSGCYLEPRFEITCDESLNPNQPLLLGRLVVSQIFLDYVIINQSISKFCYKNDTPGSVIRNSRVYPFRFSYTQNKFVAMGSDIFAFITQPPSKNFTAGCASLKDLTLRYCKGSYPSCKTPRNLSLATIQPSALSDYGSVLNDPSYGLGTPYVSNLPPTAYGSNLPLPNGGYGPQNPPTTYGSNLPMPNGGYENPYGPYNKRNRPYYPYQPAFPNNPEVAPIISQQTICFGTYCCETFFPYGLTDFNMQLNVMKPTGVQTGEREICGYAFIAQNSFRVSYTLKANTNEVLPGSTMVPAALEWGVGNISCREAEGRAGYACKKNSGCRDYPQLGYKCECDPGYKGNPYLPDGCQDVDECQDQFCHEKANCKNSPGNYSCICQHGYHGDGLRDGIGCLPVKGKLPVPLIISLGIGIAIGLLIILAMGLWLYKRLEKRKKDLLKRKFFDENGGRLLRHMMALSKGSVEKMKLFIIEELEKATDNFNVNRILGKGGFGTVYKGMLQDGSIIAVKKSDKIDEVQVEQFVNEVFILTQIEHDHIVKLLGCCLETEVPLLVYEHVSNGTLAYHLHEKGNTSTLSWEIRLRIASEIADALDYLHSYGSAAIFHRDIKSNNVLLDENLKAIVADFGISRSVSVKKTHLTASVMQGTYGYMDPEYFHTWQYTSKCDVYAFGVLLAEIVTGEKAICLDRNIQGLASYFTAEMRNGNLVEIVDRNLVLTEDQKQEILVVAEIAERCVEPTGDKRPTMAEVARQLQKLRKIAPEEQVTQASSPPGGVV